MARMMLGWNNLIDTALLNDGNWSATLPLVNLQDRTIGRVARTTDLQLTSTQFKIDIGPGNAVRIVALAGHNFSSTALYRILASNVSDFSSVVTDSGWLDVYPPAFPFGTVEWEDPHFWEGRYTDAELPEKREMIYVLPATTRAQFWRVEIDDQDNADGYVQIGRAFIGQAWQPSRNIQVGFTMTPTTDTDVQTARSGARYFDRRTTRREVQFTIANIAEDESYGVAYEIMRQMGVDGEVVFIFDPDDIVHAGRRNFLGHLAQLGGIEHPYPLMQSVGFRVSELL